MSPAGDKRTTGPSTPRVLRSRAADSRPVVEAQPAAVVALLAALAGAEKPDDIGRLTVEEAAATYGARGCVLVVRAPDAAEVEVVASVGYDCTVMGPGARLPLSSGLPVTEATRTGRPVVIGGDGADVRWVAVPLGRDARRAGGLVLSFDASPAWSADLTAEVAALATAAGRALQRAERNDRLRRAVQNLVTPLRPLPLPEIPGLDMAARIVPRDAALDVGGDLVEVVPDARGGWWIVVGDVCGSGAEAAAATAVVRYSIRALAPHVDTPSTLLGELDRVLREDAATDRFVTACAVRLRLLGDEAVLALASAGHPLPLVRRPDGAVGELGVGGLLLGVESGGQRPDRFARLEPRSTLVLYTDGLTDGPRPPVPPQQLAALLEPGYPDAAAVADALAATVTAGRDAGDDVAVLVVRVTR